MADPHGLGWLRDSLDHRDHRLTMVPPGQPLPSQVSLRDKMPDRFDQLALGSCTANAWALNYRYDARKQGLPDFMPSRLMIYYDERALEHSTRSDSGAQIRDGAKVLAKQGACAETDWPYSVAMFARKPPKACYTSGLKHRAIEYQAVPQDADAMRACLAAGYAIVIGFTCFPGLESDAAAKTGHVPMPAHGEAPIGGHAVLVTGYDDTAPGQPWEFANSWSESWGSSGFGTLPRRYLLGPQLAGDFWACRTISA